MLLLLRLMTMPYYDQPNYTMVPNQLLDFDMSTLSGSELRVLLYIVRHTLGFGKTMDAISYKQFLIGVQAHNGKQLDTGTGIKNRTQLSEALASLEKRGCIFRHVTKTTAGDWDRTVYALSVERADGVGPVELRVVGGQDAGLPVPRSGGSTEIVPPPAPLEGSTEIVPPLALQGSTEIVPQGSTEIVPGVVRKSYPQKKGTQKKSNQKKQERGVRAATPAPQRRARDHLAMVATTDDPQATAERRLALKLAGDVLGCASVNVERLACYERFSAGLLAHDYTAADLCRWMDWMNSGTAYWVGNARKWTQQRMMDDLADWDGHGRPASKEDGDG